MLFGTKDWVFQTKFRNSGLLSGWSCVRIKSASPVIGKMGLKASLTDHLTKGKSPHTKDPCQGFSGTENGSTEPRCGGVA